MQSPKRKQSKFLVPTILFGFVIAIVMLLSMGSIAGAEPLPDPDTWQFVEGPANQQNAVSEPLDLNQLGPKWRAIFSEDFENDNWADNKDKWPANADRSNTTPKLQIKWGSRLYPNGLDQNSQKTAWALGGGDEGSQLNPLFPFYPAGVNATLVAGPINLSGAEDAMVTLQLLYEANKGDKFTVAATEDIYSQPFVIKKEINKNVAQGAASWETVEVSLKDLIGKPAVHIAFTFESANGDPKKLGAMMDNVKIWTEGEPGYYLPYIAYGFTPTPPPVPPTVTPPPAGGDYEKNFTNNIDGWVARRSTFNTSSAVTHDNGEDAGRQGFLNVLVNTNNSHYVLVSPLVQAKPVPYNIESYVKLRSERNTGDQYGFVFGGNYDPAAGECLEPNQGACFTQYYELRIRFQYDEEANKDRMYAKLKRVESLDADNNNVGPDISEDDDHKDGWWRVSDVDEDDFIEWDITYSSSGKISVSANKLPVFSVTDTTYINNPYFGVLVRTEDEVDAEAKFDYIKVD